MSYVLVLLLGILGGGIAVFAVLESRRRALRELSQQLDAQKEEVRTALAAIKAREQKLREFEKRAVAYSELQDENAILKHDLQNVDVNLRKLELDRELQRERQETLDQRSKDLGGRYLQDNIKWISSAITPNNFARCKERLQKVIEWCRGIEFEVSTEQEATLLGNLREEYKKVVRAAFEREEQARIRERIREEQKLEREVKRELEQVERERVAIQIALEKALREAEHSEEVARLKAKLAEAEERSKRAISRAQMVKSGYVYVISNIGSFGEGVYKIGMTRRLEPLDRVRELGDASVPFPFDVHMMVSSDDAPALESALHRTLHKLRMNKANPRKEFFRTDIEAVRQIVETLHGEVEYLADAEALEYRESLTMSDEDLEFVERVYDELDENGESPANDE